MPWCLRLSCSAWPRAARRPPPPQQPISGHAPTGTPSDALPTFSDWRAAYVSSDGHLQVITFDGKTDLIGPALPNLTPAGLNFPTAGFAPNGHVLAYDANGITIVDVATQPMVEHSVALEA